MKDWPTMHVEVNEIGVKPYIKRYHVFIPPDNAKIFYVNYSMLEYAGIENLQSDYLIGRRVVLGDLSVYPIHYDIVARRYLCTVTRRSALLNRFTMSVRRRYLNIKYKTVLTWRLWRSNGNSRRY